MSSVDNTKALSRISERALIRSHLPKSNGQKNFFFMLKKIDELTIGITYDAPEAEEEPEMEVDFEEEEAILITE